MRQLFTIDTKDYDESGKAFVRPSVRAIIIREGKVAMVHSRKYDYYKFPGGGLEAGETNEEALARETLEEAGLRVIPCSVREYGCVHRVQKSGMPGYSRFVQDNFYYFCEVGAEVGEQHLDGYESDEGFTPVFIAPQEAIRTNREHPHGPKDQMMIEREARVLELLIREGYFD